MLNQVLNGVANLIGADDFCEAPNRLHNNHIHNPQICQPQEHVPSERGACCRIKWNIKCIDDVSIPFSCL